MAAYLRARSARCLSMPASSSVGLKTGSDPDPVFVGRPPTGSPTVSRCSAIISPTRRSGSSLAGSAARGHRGIGRRPGRPPVGRGAIRPSFDVLRRITEKTNGEVSAPEDFIPRKESAA